MKSQEAKLTQGTVRSSGWRPGVRADYRRKALSFGKPFEVPLEKRIAAIPVVLREDGHPELGAISHLSASAHFEYLGEGFNASTMRVRCGNLSYFIFREDIDGMRVAV